MNKLNIDIGYTTKLYNCFGVLKTYVLTEILSIHQGQLYNTYRFVSGTGSITLKDNDIEMIRMLRDAKIESIIN